MDNLTRLVVTISRQMGSGGAHVGQAVARRLGIRYVDRQVLEEAAKLLGVDECRVQALEDERPSLWSRLEQVLAIGTPESPYVPPPAPIVYQAEVAELESRLIREIAAADDAVIVGRAASWVLRDHPGLVSVFLHAPEPWRVERVMQTYGLRDRRAAEDLVRRTDRGRESYRAAITGAKEIDVLLGHHVSFDTAAVGLDQIVGILEALARTRRAALEERNTTA